jgi:hypothetical protein
MFQRLGHSVDNSIPEAGGEEFVTGEVAGPPTFAADVGMSHWIDCHIKLHISDNEIPST